MSRLVEVVNDLSATGGVQQLGVAGMSELQRRGHDVTIVAFRSPQNAPAIATEARMIVLESGPNEALTLLRLAAALRAIRPQFTHAGHFQADLLNRFASKLARVEYVAASDLGMNEFFDRPRGVGDRLALTVDRATARWLATVITYSEFGRRQCWRRGFPADRVTVIPNPIPLQQRPSSFAKRGLRFCALGRLHRDKGYDILIDAWQIAGLCGTDARLIIGGTGREASTLALRARGCQNIEFTGFVTNVEEFLMAASVFVQPSRVEGMPLTLNCALAMGMTAVVSGVADMASLGPLGAALVVAPEDASGLAAALRRAMDPLAQATFGLAARAYAEGIPTMREYARMFADHVESTLGRA